jgi:hypothetical protein
MRGAASPSRFVRPVPERLPPPSCLLTVAQARRCASRDDTPRRL